MRIRHWFMVLLCGGLFLAGACRRAEPAAHSGAPTAQPTAVADAGIGFATREKFREHYEKHGREFGDVSREAYLRMAQELRDRPAGGDVLESVRADGVITRFDRSTGAFLAFNSDRTIRTFFKPNDGVNYFWRQSKR